MVESLMSLPEKIDPAHTAIVVVDMQNDFCADGGPDGIMIANMIQAQFGKVNDWPMGAALAVCMMIIVGLISVTYIWMTRKMTERIA